MHIKAWGSPDLPNLDGEMVAIPADLYEVYPFVLVTVTKTNIDINRAQRLLLDEDSNKISALCVA